MVQPGNYNPYMQPQVWLILFKLVLILCPLGWYQVALLVLLCVADSRSGDMLKVDISLIWSFTVILMTWLQ